ncbi:hypothetical protein PCASD_01703 [Puccinia coronata f. sp. avenae]|uniref:Uncharacterized protein n=1 Tax=Puccinia coronata f. sp. avenae TaxID=200324 RepID=A0A2N5VJT8_9BASI|nr:hypothetical protein PCASD_01703 [Puccinia coronata f. sp. avenae]
MLPRSSAGTNKYQRPILQCPQTRLRTSVARKAADSLLLSALNQKHKSPPSLPALHQHNPPPSNIELPVFVDIDLPAFPLALSHTILHVGDLSLGAPLTIDQQGSLSFGSMLANQSSQPNYQSYTQQFNHFDSNAPPAPQQFSHFDNAPPAPQHLHYYDSNAPPAPQHFNHVNGHTPPVPHHFDRFDGHAPPVPQHFDRVDGNTPSGQAPVLAQYLPPPRPVPARDSVEYSHPPGPSPAPPGPSPAPPGPSPAPPGLALSNQSTCRRVGQAFPIMPVRPPVKHRCLSTAQTAVFNRLMPAVLSSAPLQAANIQATTQACPLPGWDQLNADAEAEWQAGKENAKKKRPRRQYKKRVARVAVTPSLMSASHTSAPGPASTTAAPGLVSTTAAPGLPSTTTAPHPASTTSEPGPGSTTAAPGANTSGSMKPTPSGTLNDQPLDDATVLAGTSPVPVPLADTTVLARTVPAPVTLADGTVLARTNPAPAPPADEEEEEEATASESRISDETGKGPASKRPLEPDVVARLQNESVDELRRIAITFGVNHCLSAELCLQLDQIHQNYQKEIYLMAITNKLAPQPALGYLGDKTRIRGPTSYNNFCLYDPEASPIHHDFVKKLTGSNPPPVVKPKTQRKGRVVLEDGKYDKGSKRANLEDVRKKLGAALTAATGGRYTKCWPGDTQEKLKNLGVQLRVRANDMNVTPNFFCGQLGKMWDLDLQYLQVAIGEGWFELTGPERTEGTVDVIGAMRVINNNNNNETTVRSISKQKVKTNANQGAKRGREKFVGGRAAKRVCRTKVVQDVDLSDEEEENEEDEDEGKDNEDSEDDEDSEEEDTDLSSDESGEDKSDSHKDSDED